MLNDAFAQIDNDPNRIVSWMTEAKPRDFGEFAPLVVEHAARGDPVGAELMRCAGTDIDRIATRLIALGADRLALVGGLAPHVGRWLGEQTARRLVSPEGDALDGALQLARSRARSLGLI